MRRGSGWSGWSARRCVGGCLLPAAGGRFSGRGGRVLRICTQQAHKEAPRSHWRRGGRGSDLHRATLSGLGSRITAHEGGWVPSPTSSMTRSGVSGPTRALARRWAQPPRQSRVGLVHSHGASKRLCHREAGFACRSDLFAGKERRHVRIRGVWVILVVCHIDREVPVRMCED